MPGAVARVRDPNLPGHRIPLQRILRRAAVAVQADEREALAVGRPARRDILRGGRREVFDRRRIVAIDADETVVGSRGDEGERRPVGRPLQIRRLTAIEEELLGGCAAVDRRDHGRTVVGEGDARAVGRDDRCVAVPEQLRRTAAGRYRPDLHLRLHRARGRVRLQRFGPVRVVIAPAHVDDVRAVVGDREIGQLLAVVAVRREELHRRELRGAREPERPHALRVERVRDCRAGLVGGDLVGKRVTQDLCKRKGGNKHAAVLRV